MSPEGTLPYVNYIEEDVKHRILELYSKHENIDDLWTVYGESLGLAATGESKGETAKITFKRRIHEIKGILCEDKKVKMFLEDPLVCNTVDLALIFAGKLLSDKFGGVDVATVSVLIAKIGLIKICQGTWDGNNHA